MSELMPTHGVSERFSTGAIGGDSGAGAVIVPVQDGALEEIEAPYGCPPDTRALRVRGDSMRPIVKDNDLILYRARPQDAGTLFNQLVVCQLDDGRVLCKELKRGRGIDTYSLESTSASPIEDVRLIWCAKVEAVIYR